jgi:hypothetical protein
MAPNIKPPAKPGKDAPQKAHAAYHSELRRYARTLEEWEARLQKMEKLLQRKDALLDEKAEMLDALEDEGLEDDDDFEGPEMLECGCSEYDARNGCDCPDCEQWRKKIGLTEEQLADMGVCEIDDYIEKRKQTPNGIKPMDDQETQFFAQYEEQMKVKE